MGLRRIAVALLGAALLTAVAFPSRHVRLAAAQGADDALLARGKIAHVIVIVMENRTFDNVFGGDGLAGHPSPYPGADALVPAPIATLMQAVPFDSHAQPGPNNWHNVYECVATQGFTDQAWLNDAASPMPCSGYKFTSPNGPFYYLDVNDRAVYWAIARQFATSDAFFAPSSADSYPGHQLIVAGRSMDTDGDQVADQTFYGSSGTYPAGCADGTLTARPTPSILVPALGPTASPWAVPTMRGFGGECYTAPTFADRLRERQRRNPAQLFLWTHYATVTSPPQPYQNEQPFNGFINSATWWNYHWPPAQQILTDANGALPNFAWVKPPCIDASDHPGTGNGGPSWVEDVVNAIGGSPAWNTTAIFVVWDDWGGFYDHAVPPSPRPNDDLGPGLRTPFLLISPYVKAGTVAHGVADYGSIMRFVEQLDEVQPLGDMDAYSPDLRGYFDFSMTPRPFATVTAIPTTTWSDACGSKAHPHPNFVD
ncbi:MAG TPA: alkaline phosphatase family protein [Candidatus Sulfotelmatobacter sp.]|nr:alkaline phosphatase family protein [Candidatus Sulfotelmatobacter sp.]